MQNDHSEIGFWRWVKAHKKQLAITGISLTALVALILGLKNKDAIFELWTILEKSTRKVSVDNSAVTTLCEYSDEITEVVTEFPDTVTEVAATTRPYTSPQLPVDIPMHIRNLPDGRSHSAVKAAEAAALDIQLLPHQTLVDAYTKYAA